MKSIKKFIQEKLFIRVDHPIKSDVDDIIFDKGDKVYCLKRHTSKWRGTTYEIVDDTITNARVITIVHTDKTKEQKMEYRIPALQGWTTVVFKTKEEAKQYCIDKKLKMY